MFRYGMSGAGLAADGAGTVFVSGGVGGKGGGILSAVDETLTYHVKKKKQLDQTAGQHEAGRTNAFQHTFSTILFYRKIGKIWPPAPLDSAT